MQRYLLNIAYMGTRFHGMAKNLNVKNHKHNSVEENLMDALKTLHPVNPVELQISSRTDAGVHALNTTVHVDLESHTGVPMHPNLITKRVNETLNAWHLQLRILNTRSVSNTFHSRFAACSRTYMYRLAVAKASHPKGISTKVAVNQMFVPIEEYNRCHFILNEDFDIERVRVAAKLLEGVHDFRSFMKTSKEQKTLHPRFCLRRMQSVKIKQGTTLATPVNYDRTIAEYDFWNFEFKSKAFFYRQIRNMVSILIAAGRGRISQRDIYEMLTIPSKYSWMEVNNTAAPCHGLYLVNVDYPDYIFTDDVQNIDFEG